ncbi:hypothetical protein M433DRAFT_157523 [Acidomyces richmondensis BFW]|nr:MAG: hypothetical protein FE78DRAFT_87709 [Acidomyces sp. 'richmondensis']KYG42758.1 hypothetical protein M433DRAFT_157523 [Acidomyces richmondensis BFW]
MPVYHIVLFQLNPDTPADKVAELKTTASEMVGQIPGLSRLDIGPPLAITAHRANGFDMGIVAILDRPEDIQVYAEHPAHLRVHKLREALCSNTIVYDLEF